MHTTHRTRFVSSCAVLALCQLPMALCFLPRVGVAQATARKNSSKASESQTVEPFYFRPLTREGIGTLPNVDAQNVSDGRVAPDGHMIITGAITEAYVLPGKHVELLPNFDLPGFTAVTYRVYENDKPTELVGALEMAGERPPIIINQPANGSSRRVMKVAAFDGQNHVRVVMQCTLRSHVASDNVADLALARSKEQCRLSITDNQTLTARHLYLGDICLGRVEDKAGKIDMDERCLAPGKYTCQMIAKNEDNILLPGPSTGFVVEPRYTISCKDGDSKIVIPEGDADATLEVNVTHRRDADIKMTRVYIGGIKGGEMEGESFNIKLPLKEVPTGKTPIEVIGIGQDGVEYPVESFTVDLQNGAWWTHVQGTDEYQKIEENKEPIRSLERSIAASLEQAKHEKGHIDREEYTLEKFTRYFAASKKPEYMAKAKGDLVHMAQTAGRIGQAVPEAENVWYGEANSARGVTGDGNGREFGEERREDAQ